MGLGFKNLKRGEHCPVCGHKDWCASIPDDPTYGTIYRCQRYTGNVDHVAQVIKIYGGKEKKEYVTEYQIIDGAEGRFVKLPTREKHTQGGSFQSYDNWYGYINNQLKEYEEKNMAYCAEHKYTYKRTSFLKIDGVEEMLDSSYVYVAPTRVEWKPVGIVKPLEHRKLDAILRKWLDCFVLAPCHKAKLLMEWDVSDKPFLIEKGFEPEKIFARWKLRTMPPEDDVRKDAPDYYKERTAGPTRAELINRLLEICKANGLESPEGIPGIYFNEKLGRWDILSRSGIIFPVVDVNGWMYRFRIGTDTPDVIGELKGKKGRYRFYKDMWFFEREDKPKDEKSVLAWKHGSNRNLIMLNKKGLPAGKPDGKYVNLSSYTEVRDYENHTFTNRFKGGSRCGGCLSVYRPTDNPPVRVWFTEGEKKSMVSSMIKKDTFVCIPGVSSFGKVLEPIEGGMNTVEVLLEEGATTAIVAFDADKETNEAVMNAQNGLAAALLEAGFAKVYITKWDESQGGKGLDDTFLEGADPKFVRYKG